MDASPSSRGPGPHTADAAVRYTLGEVLGEGALGRVVAAEDAELQRPVALKYLKEARKADASDVQRFLHEAEILARLEHPSVPPVHTRGTLPTGQPFYTMRLVRGTTLREQLKCWRITDMGRPAERAKLLDSFEKICDALGHAHTVGIIHRDLKPSNVMTGDHGEVYVLDWGLARTVEPKQHLTKPYFVMGTPAYMSP